MRRNFLHAAVALVLGAAVGSVAAQDYPTRPIRLVLPSATGGAGDLLMRLIGARLQPRLGQNIVMDFRPGAGGIIGMQHVAQSAPDGYTLVMGYIGVASVNPFIYTPAPYDTRRDFTPVSMVATFPMVLAVKQDMPARNVQELIAYAKANPGKLNYASAGTATSPHLTTELFKRHVGIDMLHIPFKGAGPAMIDFLAGRIDVYFENLATMKTHVDKGRFRILGIATATRSPLAPEIPTLTEGGVQGFQSVGWFGIFAPMGTPAPIVNKLATEIAAIMKTEDMQKALRERGLDPVSTSASEFRSFLETDIEKWSRVVREANIKAG